MNVQNIICLCEYCIITTNILKLNNNYIYTSFLIININIIINNNNNNDDDDDDDDDDDTIMNDH